MEQAKALLDMGEHAVFIWAAYGISALVLALLVFATLRRIRDSERRLQQLSGDRPTTGRDDLPTGRDDRPTGAGARSPGAEKR